MLAGMVAAPTTPPSSRGSVSGPIEGRALVAHLWSSDLPREHDFEPLTIEGTLPRSLRGTLYRNGPGQFGQFGTRYTHPFEADGAVTAVRIVLVLVTVMFRVVVTGAAMPSVTLTVKLLDPTSLLVGVPVNVPLAATDNHAGPLTLAKDRLAPASASEALVARLPL